MLAGAGDELQGIKRGVIELADMIAVTKSDGDNVERAGRAAAELRGALNILTPREQDWMPPVLTISAQENRGLDNLWDKVLEHRRIKIASGELEMRRSQQRVTWMRDMLTDRLTGLLRTNTAVAENMRALEAKVAAGSLAPTLAVSEALALIGLDSL